MTLTEFQQIFINATTVFFLLSFAIAIFAGFMGKW